jgi:hypothetical protein
MPPRARRRAASRLLSAASVAAAALVLTACERLQQAFSREPQVDLVWQGDSTFVVSRPTVLFRVLHDGRNSARIIPVASAGRSGFEPMLMSDRGWRLYDLSFMQSTATVTPLRDGKPLAPVSITRGMWEGAPLDTLQGCNVMPPAALVTLPADVDLVASGENIKAASVPPLSGAERETALAAIPTLIAPSAGVPPSMIGRYQRRVYTVPTGTTRGETIVITYDDPEVLPDSVVPMAQRPRQLIVVLDRGVYGYKPSYVFKTIGNAKDLRRRRFLGAFDADGDGRAELFFGLQAKEPLLGLVTYGLKWESDSWHERFKYERLRCHG